MVDKDTCQNAPQQTTATTVHVVLTTAVTKAGVTREVEGGEDTCQGDLVHGDDEVDEP